jgi:hypothetical protein
MRHFISCNRTHDLSTTDREDGGKVERHPKEGVLRQNRRPDGLRGDLEEEGQDTDDVLQRMIGWVERIGRIE